MWEYDVMRRNSPHKINREDRESIDKFKIKKGK